MDGKTVKFVFDLDFYTKKVYIDNVLVGTDTTVYFDTNRTVYAYLGGIATLAQNNGDQCYDMTITGIRIYDTE